MQRILIVEDDIEIQDMLRNYLTDAGYEVVIAEDGVTGIAKFDDTINLVLLDIMLPKIDGYGVCEVIRQRSQVPIIMLTALSDEENQIKGFEQQIDDYIPKPFSPKSPPFFAAGHPTHKNKRRLSIKIYVWILMGSIYITKEKKLY